MTSSRLSKVREIGRGAEKRRERKFLERSVNRERGDESHGYRWNIILSRDVLK